MVKFATFTSDEQGAVEQIVERALALWAQRGMAVDRRDLEMDLSATHAYCPLRLHDLATADDENFAHDVVGIRRHLDRTTGALRGFFLPRYAAPQADAHGRSDTL